MCLLPVIVVPTMFLTVEKFHLKFEFLWKHVQLFCRRNKTFRLCGKAWIAYLGIVQEYDVRAKQIINRYEYNI